MATSTTDHVKIIVIRVPTQRHGTHTVKEIIPHPTEETTIIPLRTAREETGLTQIITAAITAMASGPETTVSPEMEIRTTPEIP